MDVYVGLDPGPPALPGPVVTIGSFDGIHRGHQALIGRVQEKAAERDGTGILLTFEPHPQRVIAPGSAPPLLTLREEKLPLLEAEGLETTVILPFNRALSEVEAEDFVRDILVDRLGVKYLVLGYDHAFGRGRRGRPELLREMAPGLGFDLEVLEAVTEGDEAITSSLIRRELEGGDVERAARLLGRPYSMVGYVVKGDRRGTRMGFPTANLAPPSKEKCIPGNGVYAVRARVREEMMSGVCSIGTRPTFETRGRTVEVHLFEFEGEIYGESLELRFLRRLREEIKFEHPEALQKQIGLDITEAKRILAEEVR
ncbi:MAG: bifunctional riboflavin kinase/FAD synthetase [bacterium]